MKKGIVMEIDGRFLTLLTPEGEFLKARKEKQDYLIGQEIDFFPINGATKKKSMFYHFPGKMMTAAAVALMVGVGSFLPIYNSNAVYAYMTIDVNPSIELAVNDDLKVVKMEAYNIEGKQIITELKNWKHEQVSEVTTLIIQEIKDRGYFQNHNEVVISTVVEDKKETKVEKKLQANIEQIEEKVEQENVQLTVVQGTKKERAAAVKKGVTTGVYKEQQIKVEKKEKNNNEKGQNENSTQPNRSDKKLHPNKENKPEDKQDNKNQQAPGQQKKEDKEQKELDKFNSERKKTVATNPGKNLEEKKSGQQKGNGKNKEKKNKENKHKKEKKKQNNQHDKKSGR